MIAKLGEIAEFINGGAWSDKEYTESGIPVVKVTNLKNGTVDLSEVNYIPESSLDKYGRHILRKGDLVIATVGSHPNLVASAAGRATIIPAIAEGTLLNQNALCIRTNSEILHQGYLGYLGKSDIFQGYVKSVGKGAANQVRIALGLIKEFSFNLPPLPTQRRIASILSAYDNLIENNLKRIKLLEEKAQLHYKELITLGKTETKYFEEFCSIVHGYAFKSTDFSEDKTFDIVVRMGNFKEGGGIQFDNNTKFLNENFEFNPKYKLEPNDLVMVLSDVTREGRIIGNVGLIPSNGKTYLLNQRVGKIVTDEKYKLWLYVTFNSKEFKDYCLSCANSATVLNFNNKDLFKFQITIPKETELKDFTERVKPIFALVRILDEQNSKLREARDILLPKLMNGQIEV
jgi:type I restriction enzyme S subunit